jgi:AbrB family looped-hinge helix DNA binding protein
MNEHARIVGGSKTTSKGQTTIPKEVRDVMGIKDGTPLTWTYENGELKVRARTKRLEDFVPMKPPNGRRLKIEDFDDAIGKAVAEEFERGPKA